MFSNPTKNRVHRRKFTSGNDLANDFPSSKKGIKKAASEMHLLHAKIGALESYLAKRAESDASHSEMRRVNVMPPPERDLPRAQKVTERSYSETRRYHAVRNRAGMRFLILFGIACTIGWWLIFS